MQIKHLNLNQYNTNTNQYNNSKQQQQLNHHYRELTLNHPKVILLLDPSTTLVPRNDYLESNSVQETRIKQRCMMYAVVSLDVVPVRTLISAVQRNIHQDSNYKATTN